MHVHLQADLVPSGSAEHEIPLKAGCRIVPVFHRSRTGDVGLAGSGGMALEAEEISNTIIVFKVSALEEVRDMLFFAQGWVTKETLSCPPPKPDMS